MANRVIPETLDEALMWMRTHHDAWVGVAAQIGLSVEELERLDDAVSDAQAKRDAAKMARALAQAATVAQDAALEEARGLAAGLVAVIKARAVADNNPDIYAAALIPPPRKPGPSQQPETPLHLSGSINTEGLAELRWAAKLGNGLFFTVWRNLGDGWVQVASLAKRRWMDDTLPMECSHVMYGVRAHRGDMASALSEPLSLFFGARMRSSTDRAA